MVKIAELPIYLLREDVITALFESVDFLQAITFACIIWATQIVQVKYKNCSFSELESEPAK